jgi:hypothetical protein
MMVNNNKCKRSGGVETYRFLLWEYRRAKKRFGKHFMNL